MLAVVALVPVVALVALVPMVPVVALVALVPMVPMVALVALLSVGTRGAVLSVPSDGSVISAQSGLPPRAASLVHAVRADEQGRSLLTLTRVAGAARRYHDRSDTIAMLAVVPLVALVALVSVVALVPLVALQSGGTRSSVLSVQSGCSVPSVQSRRPVLSALPRHSVLSAADVGGSGAVIYPRPIDKLLGVDGDGRTLFTSRERVLQVGRLDENSSEA